MQRPKPYRYRPALLEAMITERKSAQERMAAAQDRAGHGGDRRSDVFQGSVRSLKHGETADYLAARIKHDHPEIHKRVLAGEFKSIKAAAREAGIIERTIEIRLDPVAAAASIRRHTL